MSSILEGLKKSSMLLLCVFNLLTISTAFADNQANRNLMAKVYRENIQTLQRKSDRSYGIEVILVAPGLSPASRFGHVGLRFLEDRKNPLSDIVIDFVADVPSAEMNWVAGIDGTYRTNLQAENLYSFMFNYLIGEQRSLNRMIVPTSPEERERLLDSLMDIVEGRFQLPQYTFLNHNCAKAMADLLVRSKIGFWNYNPLIPIQFDRWLVKNNLSPYPPLADDSLLKLNIQVSQILNDLPARTIHPRYPWQKEKVERLLSNISATLHGALFMIYGKAWLASEIDLMDLAKTYKFNSDYEVVKNVPEEFYQTGAVQDLPQINKGSWRNLFSSTALKEKIKQLQRNEYDQTLADNEPSTNLASFPLARTREQEQRYEIIRIITASP